MNAEDRRQAFFERIVQEHNGILRLADPIHSRILLCSLIDVLSRAAYPALKRNRNRIVRLIDEFSTWDARTRYSLRQLDQCLKNLDPSASPALSALSTYVTERLVAWPSAPVILTASSVDPTHDDLLPFLDEPLAKEIEYVRYPQLFYTMRNYAIHEMIHPGEGADFELGRAEPYYHTIETLLSGTMTWGLYFPLELISSLVLECAERVLAFLSETERDPWKPFIPRPDWYRSE